MTTILFRVGAALLGIITQSTVALDDDPIQTKLEQSKDRYQKAVDQCTKELNALIDQKIEAARKDGNRELLKQLQEQKEAFRTSGKMPTAAPTTVYRSAMAKANKEMLAAFDLAIKDFTKAAKDSKADAADEEKKKFLAKNGELLKMDPIGVIVKGSDLAPGLLIREYKAQTTQDEGKEFIEVDKLRDTVGGPTITESISPWKYTQDFNAVASGYIRIAKAGEYSFNSNNFYDRNALYINSQLVCAFRDGDSKLGKITLQPGFVSIQSVGYIHARGSVTVKWQPPGADKLDVIPANLLFHSRAAEFKKK